MGATNTGYVMTLANSIIGVGILAMPFCFQKCGIILSILLLLLSNLITRLSCHYLLKTAILNRKRTFEFLAFHIFGSSGKLMVELCVIGYLMGTCTTYFVVLGDLGPQITAKLFDLNASDTLRTWVMIFVTIVCIIPLGLLKNIESLAHICTTSIIFYFCLVIKVIAESEPHISTGDWYENVALWQPSGVLQCLPILVMATSCQTNIFEVYDSLPNPTLQRMNDIVKSATALCTCAYVLVGFFGYVAFNTQIFSGNVMLYFSASLVSDIIKVGFFLSVACSFPLVIFPCRASLYSLLYRRSYSEAAHYIPEHRFKYITISMIVTALLVGIMIPSIELVIGLVGSTIGVGICIMFPAACFVKSVKKNSTERLLAQAILIFGFLLMILGTFANLNAIDEKKSGADLEHTIPDGLQSRANFHENDIPRKLELQPLPDLDKVVESKIVEPPPQSKAPVEEPKAQISGNTDAVREIQLAPIKEAKLPVKTATVPVPKIQEPIVESKPVEKLEPMPEVAKQSVGAVRSDSVINKDAIQKEDQEMAIAHREDAGEELKQTKELLEQVKDQLEKQNKETQKLVLDKIEKISQKVDKIGQANDIDLKESAIATSHNSTKSNAPNVNAPPGAAVPNTVVKLLLDNKQDTNNLAYKIEENAVHANVNRGPKASTDTVKLVPLQQLQQVNAALEQAPGHNDHKDQISNHIENNRPPKPIDDKPVPNAEINADGAQRDLLSVKTESSELNGLGPSARLVDREKREINQKPNHGNHQQGAVNSVDPLPIVQNHKEAENVLNAGEAIIPAVEIQADPKVFVRDLRSINDTKPVESTRSR